jgi:mercuric ion binding protein
MNIQTLKNNTLMKNLMIIMLVGLSITASAKKVTTTFWVEAQCGDCKERIENALDVKGISFAELNLETKEVTVRFNDSKISEEEIHQIISKIGYNTKQVKADMEAQKALPGCCQPKVKSSCCTKNKKCSGSKKE